MFYICQIDFKDQSKYEINKGFIKDIIKRKHRLSSWDSDNQRWYNPLILDVEVKRLVSPDGLNTIGLKVAGSRELSDSLVLFLKDVSGVSITFFEVSVVGNPVDNEVKSIINVEVVKFTKYIDNRIKKDGMTKEYGDKLIKLWESAVASYEYNKRGIKY